MSLRGDGDGQYEPLPIKLFGPPPASGRGELFSEMMLPDICPNNA